MFYTDEQQKKRLQGIFQDFFRDCSSEFKGRVDEGNITLKELNDYISAWIETHFNDEDYEVENA